ncbi:MAG TPA: universal stress protein [Kofleriaceae bacterium]|nr:universal stress protein [Kofleriaceae bacterium]
MPRRFGIVAAIDLSEYAEIVLEHAFDQVARHTAADLHVVTVVEHASELEDTKRRMAALVLPALDNLSATDWCVKLHVRAGRVHEEITSLAAELRADLIVVGRFGLHHPGMDGSVASRVVDTATCPTLVVGLTDDSPDAITACEHCVAVRRDSAGERWFCAEHSAPDRASLASVALTPSTWTGGGLMW